MSAYAQVVSTFRENSRPDEEQPWLFGFRERWESVFQQKTNPETMYIAAAVRSDTAVRIHASSM